ncbi:hypothetical protein Pla110_02890 [Polystyrenella longa]|uniref:Uncharacterized protein n=1 Tax=Polystyrenella longa TaxID=2528007 RepID=A0A518CH80_9PLAN|nr:hypothetical protein Pla110_02890 [Polystyrenella longa]
MQYRCALCAEGVDISDADPSLEVLTERMGFLDDRLGSVQMLRNELPQTGHLYSATKGLLFLPQETRDVVDEATCWKPQSTTGHWWSTVKSMMPQAALIDWLAHRFHENNWNESLLPPPDLDPHAPQLLARLLMQHPGVLFIEHTSIQQFRNRKRNWTLYRHGTRTVHFRVLGDRHDFHTRIEAALRFTHTNSTTVEML